MIETVIETREVRLAVRDGEGSGLPLLLLHGAGGNLVTLTAFAEALQQDHRVVTLDLRGHGKSSDAPWDWDGVLDDLAIVVDRLKLGEPAVVGMSLGGMVAALWGEEHPGCPGVVSLDGNPPPSRPEQLAGMDPARAIEELSRLHARFTVMREFMARPLTAEELGTALEAQRVMAQRFNAPEELWVEAFLRNLTVRNGQASLRPRPDAVEQLRMAQESIDLFPVYRAVRCPLLLVQATRDLPEQQPFAEVYAAYRYGLGERVAAVAGENPMVEVIFLDGASQAMVAEHPAFLARVVNDFLSRRA